MIGVNHIGPQAGYASNMVSALVRLVLAISLALLPAGMTGSAASAGPPATSSQCADHGQPAHSALDTTWHCAACAVLPAAEPSTVTAPPPRPLLVAIAAAFMMGLEPDVATPPPKLA